MVPKLTFNKKCHTDVYHRSQQLFTGTMKKKRPSKQQLPSSGSSPMFSLRIPADLMKRIEEFAAADALAKGAAIKLLIERGLEVRP